MLIKNQTIKLLGLTILCTILSACNLDKNGPVHDAGSADFSTFVSLGDSLTAGYADGALYQMGQKNSFPAILAEQFSLVGGGDFIQPMMSDNLGGLLFNGSPYPDPDTDPGTPAPYPTRLVLNEETQSPVFIEGSPTTEVISNSLTGSFNNMGVPGAKSFHLKSTSYGDPSGLSQNPSTANPYFVRFASTAATSMIADAAIQQPSFFSLWIGSNDVLSYATSGGVGLDQTGNFDPATYGRNDISDPMVFANIYSDLITALSGAGGKGVLINIPNVIDLPFFTTVPYNPLLLDQATADSLNAFYASSYNMLLEGLVSDEELNQRTISFSAGQNAVIIEDENLSDLSPLPSIRQATPEDLLLLTTSSKIGKPVDANTELAWGLTAPLEDGDVLIPSEINAIAIATSAYNASIEDFANADNNLLMVDIASLLNEIKSGMDYGTGYVDASYIDGGAFSLDGVHPTARGYAIIANTIIGTINNGFDARLPTVDPGTYTTIFVE